MAKDHNGFYIQEDYWLSVAELPKGQQDKAMGAIVRLFFTGEDNPPAGAGAKSSYYGIRDRVVKARNKVFGKDDNNDQEEAVNDHENGSENGSANSDFPIKEGEGGSYTSSGRGRVSTPDIQPVSIPQVDIDLDGSSKFVADALLVFSEVTERACLMPGGMVVGYLQRIYEAGYTLDDVRTVCAFKHREWKDDPTMRGYIRPSTLFKPSKFEGYLAAAKNDPGVSIDAEAAEFAAAF